MCINPNLVLRARPCAACAATRASPEKTLSSLVTNEEMQHMMYGNATQTLVTNEETNEEMNDEMQRICS